MYLMKKEVNLTQKQLKDFLWDYLKIKRVMLLQIVEITFDYMSHIF